MNTDAHKLMPSIQAVAAYLFFTTYILGLRSLRFISNTVVLA